MRLSGLLVLLIAGNQICAVVRAQDSIFIATPVSVAAAINTTATFTCTAARGDSLGWYVDGEAARDTHIRDRNISFWTGWIGGNIHSILYVLSMEYNNNTRVECGVYIYREGEERSDAVYLTVQGLLAAPGGVSTEQRDKGSISFTWEHPFSLHGVPITSYWFYYTKNNGRATKIELLGNSTAYEFSVADPNPCDSYMFQVSAVNAGGEGNLSTPIETHFHDHPRTLNGGDVTVKFEFISVTQVKLSFTFPENNSCSVQTTDRFTILMSSRTNDTVNCLHRDLTTSLAMNSTGIEFSTSIEELPLNDVYSTTITRGNAIGNTTSNGMINASTFDVQSAKVDGSRSGNVCVICEFAKGSNAAGCTTVNQEHTINITGFKHSDSAIGCHPAQLSAGYHTFLVYDMEADGTISESPAVERTISVNEDPDPEQEDTESLNEDDSIILVGSTLATIILAIVLVVLVVILIVVVKARNPKQRQAKKADKEGEQSGDPGESGDYNWTDNVAYGQYKRV